MKKKWIVAAAVMLIVAGCSNETVQDELKEETTKTQVAETSTVKEDVKSLKSAEMTELKEAVPALVNEISNKLETIKLPDIQEGHQNRPISSLNIDEDSFNLYISLEDISTESSGIPLNIYIRTFEKEDYQFFLDEGFTKLESNREYLIAPNGSKKIVFIDGDYLYEMNSISNLMNYEGSTYSVEQLLDIADQMNTDSEYKQFFEVNIENYKLPTYFLNDGKEPYRLFVNYTGNKLPFEPEEQSLQISNNTMNFEQSSLYPHYEAYGDEIVIQENVGYLSTDDNSNFEMVNGDQLYSLSLATADVNQTTGKPSYVEVPNWQEEITKVIESLNLPKQERATKVKDTSEYEEVLKKQQREREMRLALIKEVYIESTLADSVFFERALQFHNLGPENSVGYMKEQLFKRFIKVDNEFERLNLMEISKTHIELMNENAKEGIEDLFEFYSINPTEVFYLQEDIEGEPTFYWVLQMEQSVDGYKVLNIYDTENEMFLTDF
ncbi:hypothetical protein PGC35_02450 [Psychrobacillus sp. PGGUH221]|uniref:hypothetical protein n=1 Tax=Psychrobacillus sp. PGGUH221 TaxID=3020058 RepID=UPI0035C66CA2